MGGRVLLEFGEKGTPYNCPPDFTERYSHGHRSNGSWVKCLMGHVGHGSSCVTHRLLWSKDDVCLSMIGRNICLNEPTTGW
jgi:hypothetical protein